MTLVKDFARSRRAKKSNYNRRELFQWIVYRNINSTSWAQTHAKNEIQLFNAFSNLLSFQHYKDVYCRESLHESSTWYTTLRKLHCWKNCIVEEVCTLRSLDDDDIKWITNNNKESKIEVATTITTCLHVETTFKTQTSFK